MQSTEWFPLPEVSGNEEKPWWKDADFRTTRHVSNLSQSTLVENNSTPKLHTLLTSECPKESVSAKVDESIADLTITSLRTISPPIQTDPVTSKGIFKTSTAQLSSPSSDLNAANTAQLSSPPSDLNAANKPTQASHSSTSQMTSAHSYYSSNNHTTASHSTYSPPSRDPASNSKSCSYSPVSTSQPPFYAPPLATYTEAVAERDAVTVQYTSLLELDKLWRKFLTNSLVNTNKETCPGSQWKSESSRRDSHRDTPSPVTSAHLPPIMESAPISHIVKVTTSNFSTTQSSSYSNEKKPTNHTPRYSIRANDHTPHSSIVPKFVDKSVQTSQDLFLQTSQDLSFQTSQDLSLQKRPPVSFTIPMTQTKRTTAKREKSSTQKPPTAFTVTFNTRPFHQPLPEVVSAKTELASSTTFCHDDPLDLHGSTPLSKVPTLSEDFALHHPEFIVRSQRREDRVRQVKEIRIKKVNISTTVTGKERVGQRGHVCSINSSATNPEVKRIPHHCPLLGLGTRPKLGHRKMYLTTKKVWDQLPEIKKRFEEERKKTQAETNRLRVKLYQKEVLTRLRERTKRQ